MMRQKWRFVGRWDWTDVYVFERVDEQHQFPERYAIRQDVFWAKP